MQLPPFNDGLFTKTNGIITSSAWRAWHSYVQQMLFSLSGGGGGPIVPSGSVVAETSYGQASNPGIAASYSRGDHTHGSPPLDGTLAALAGLTISANKLILCTGADAFVVGALTNAYVDAAAAIDESKLNLNFATHTLTTVTAVPLTIAGQAITFNYDATTLGVAGNNLYVKNDGHTHATQYAALSHHTQHEIAGSDLVDHDNLTNFVANEHIDWTGASDDLITSGFIRSSGSYLEFNTELKYNGNQFISFEGTSSLWIGENNSRGAGYTICIGDGALGSLAGGLTNFAIGFNTLAATTTGNQNFGLGTETFRLNVSGSYGMAGGHQAGYFSLGDYNMYFGWRAGFHQQNGDDVVMIGAACGEGAGPYDVSGVVWLGRDVANTNLHISNTLQIHNSDTATPLIYGEFDNGILKFNAKLTIASTIAEALVIGAGTAGIDYQVKFDGETNDGLLTWMEDEDYFRFSDDIGLISGEFLILDKASGNGIKVDTTTPTFGWRDLRAEIRTRGVGATDPNDTTYIGNVKAYSFAVNDEAWIEFHIPHDYVLGTDILLHFHWSHNSAIVTGGNITLGADVTYAKGHDQAAFAATVNPTLTPNASTTQYQHMVSEVQLSASAPGAAQLDTDDLEPDGLILARVFLSANNITSGGAVPDPFIHEVDVHYQSTNIATKQNAPDFYT